MKVWTVTLMGLSLMSGSALAQQSAQVAPPAAVAPPPAAAAAADPQAAAAPRPVRPALLAGPAITPEQRTYRFDLLDIDRNGLLTKEEWLHSIQDPMKPYADQIWAMMDTASKGSVTREQYVGFRPQRPA